MKAPLEFFKHLGFETWGRYWSFAGHPQANASEGLRQVHPVKPDVALSRYESFHPIPQCWERDAHTLQLYAGRLSGYAFWEQDQHPRLSVAAYTIIMDLALDPHADPIRVGTALLQRAAVDVKEALHIDKVAAQDPVRAVLEQVGLTPHESHVHMGQHIIKRMDKEVGVHEHAV